MPTSIPQPVTLAPAEAYLITAVHTALFVGSLYLFRTKELARLSRNHPRVIRQRIASVSCAILASVALSVYFLAVKNPAVDWSGLLPSVIVV
ncbi:hypothetical protein H4R33_003274 [Dimargaris cristalligena]|nr:hypothetical protein H4R33_003274 [Dimargaris cristalligena]